MNIYLQITVTQPHEKSHLKVNVFPKKAKKKKFAMPSSAEQEHFMFYFISSCFKLGGLECVSSLDCKIYLCRKLLLKCFVIEA